MAASTSKAVDPVVISDKPCEDDPRPIMLLLKRLIKNKQNTVMTNSQIYEILDKEFGIDVNKCSKCESDIYVKIIKKFLKDWPQWEELERISSKLSSAKDFDAVTKVLENKYKKLKEYLGEKLARTQQITKEAIEGATANIESDSRENDVVMEVHCTRDQLTHLVYSKPRASADNAIFNIAKIEPTRISLNTLSFESILNYWSTKVFISLPYFVFFREVIYKFEHTLLNLNNYVKSPPKVIDTRVFNRANKAKDVTKDTVFANMDKILNLTKKDEHLHQLLNVLFQIFKKDMAPAPAILKVPSTYKKASNRYEYIRYLSVNHGEPSDAQEEYSLKEVTAPVYQYFVGRVMEPEATLPPIQDWLKIECMFCKVKFPGSTELMSVVQAHFNDHHQNERDWQCTHCDNTYTVDYLSKNRWKHVC